MATDAASDRPIDPGHRTAAGDAFAVGILVMLIMSVFQRCVGLLRGIGFCHFLDDHELGRWAMMNSLFTLAVPLAVLGLPGSFGKFTEVFRQRGQLRRYLQNVTSVSLLGLTIFCFAIWFWPEQFSKLVVDTKLSSNQILLSIAALISVTAFSFLNELLGSLRQVRCVSLMQFAQSSAFCVIGLSWLVWEQNWFVLIPSFAAASLIGCIPAVWVLATQHHAELSRQDLVEPHPVASESVASSDSPKENRDVIWSRILPYAIMLWLMDLISNLFATSDRYMLLHLASDGQGSALVGQYHAGFILPNLLISVALMFSGVFLPFLSKDWEAKRHTAIANRLRQVLISASMGFVVLSIGAMVASPILYHWIFAEKFGPGHAMLPLALVQASFVGLSLIAEAYLLCAERTRDILKIHVSCLLLNLVLNAITIPIFGLVGAVASTTAATLLSAMLVILVIGKRGCPLGGPTICVCLIPLSIALGPIAACLTLVAFVYLAGRTDLILDSSDRAAIDAMLLPKISRFGLHLQSLWP